ncbi:MAG: hypothetical protein AAFY76_05485, partial [Cyanobacteria bacterium J06649_11]
HAIPIACGFWQIRVFEEGDFIRMAVPLSIAAVAIAGVILKGIISITVDDKSLYTWSSYGSDVWKVILLGLAFNFKAFLGPLFVGFTICTSIYFLFEYGHLDTWNFVESFLKYIFGSLPDWVSKTYIISSFIIILGGSILDGDFDF